MRRGKEYKATRSVSLARQHSCAHMRRFGRVSRIWAIRDVPRRRCWRARFCSARFHPCPFFLHAPALHMPPKEKKTHGPQSRPGACAWVFFSPREGTSSHIHLSHMQNTRPRPTLLFFVRKKKLCEMHLHARPRKNSLFCISPWESNWNNYFLRSDESTLGKNLNPGGKKSLGDFFRARAIHGITVATGLQQCVSEIEFFIV